jgi:amino acid transporter
MAEELQDASRSLPLAMVWTAIVNGAMGFVMIVTFCMMIGDVDTALNSPTGYAFIDVFYNATKSKAGTSGMVALFIIMLLFGCVTNFATSSRQLWAFVSRPCSLMVKDIPNIFTGPRPWYTFLQHPR